MDLYRHSIDVILRNQHAGGAYVASPNFETYHYCWLRDGSFTAYAMDVAGHSESAEKFYRWVGSTIMRYANKVDVLEAQINAHTKPDHRGILNTRLTLDGFEEEGSSDWGNFQVDGYGSWLWGLSEHVRITQNFQLLKELSGPINTTLRYLKLVWQLPNYDCWEEHPEYLHPYSLSTIYGGLAAMADLQSSGKLYDCSINAADLAAEVKEFLASHALQNGRFIKHLWPARNGENVKPVSNSGVDASLLGLVVPFGVFNIDDPRIIATVQAIESDLHLPDGGVYRYKEDVYYGGGEWIILAAWLGWYYAQAGKLELAKDLLKWIESAADKNGDLTEQVSTHMLAPDHFEPWRKRWGEVANPLLWSHAMYLLLVNVINKSHKK